MNREKLKSCFFCERSPRVTERPDSLDGFYCSISCFCGGYSSRVHQFATSKENPEEAYKIAASKWNERLAESCVKIKLWELAEDTSVITRRRGVFQISDKLYEEPGTRKFLASIMARVIIVRADHDYMRQCFCYTAYSEIFEALTDEIATPLYRLSMDAEGNVKAEREPDGR